MGVTAVLAIAAKLLATFRYAGSGLPISTDSLMLQHPGWYMLNGATLYSDFVEVKPPVVYETTALLSVVTGNNPIAIHVLGMVITQLAVVLSSVGIALIVHYKTSSPVAAVAAGVSLYALPATIDFGWGGFLAKPFAVMFGIYGIYFLLRDLPLFAGLLSALSAAYWQPSLIFSAIIIGMAVRSRRKRRVLRVIGGGIVAVVVVLGPVVIWRAIDQMLLSVFVIPSVASGSTTFIQTLHGVAGGLGYGGFVVLIGGVGVLIAASAGDLWPIAGAGWGVLQVFVLDYDAGSDLFVGMAFAAIGVGFAVSETRGRWQQATVLVLALTVVISGISGGWLGLVAPIQGPPNDTLHESQSGSIPPEMGSGGVESMHTVFWDQRTPKSCYYTAAASGDLRSWLKVTGQPIDRNTCPGASEFWQ
ncbi:hypothetical protein C451_20642 [Halococcus thailandensis JCM 13552]|uniref:Glycosyltransferase RgtA/B/C/D-like domain-containing protein n=1 Tax=Halococcus thailandensis JCM 13552 TaxID=1227457 RepID=M0MRI8_9EURY|nr:hypothetical protein C451_20642 [Halococcus thailandensis JCM 13552]